MTEPCPRVRALLGALGLDVTPSPSASPFPFHRLRDAVAGSDLAQLRPTSASGARWQVILHQLADAPPVTGAGEPAEDAPPLGRLEDALDVHQALEVRLVVHRLALMAADVDAAATSLDAFARVMRHHLAVEDAHVAPRYLAAAPADGWPRGGDPKILVNEHGKIRSRLDELAERIDAVRRADLPKGRRRVACLEILDREKVFHDLLEHHDLRERTLVYPRLAQTLDAATQDEIVARLLDPEPWGGPIGPMSDPHLHNTRHL